MPPPTQSMAAVPKRESTFSGTGMPSTTKRPSAWVRGRIARSNRLAPRTASWPHDRYVNDDSTIQAITQMWARVGVRAEAQAMPSNLNFSRGARNEFSIGLLGWGTGTGEPDSPMIWLIATPNPGRRRSISNRSLCANPACGAMLEQALVTIDNTARGAIYRQAARLAMEYYAIIPLHHQVNIWASRRGVAAVARNDEETYAMSVRPAVHRRLNLGSGMIRDLVAHSGISS